MSRRCYWEGESEKVRRPLKYSSLGGRYGEENFVYLSSYVLASRSSDVSSQFGRLQSDQLQLQAEGNRKGRKKTREMRIARIRGGPSRKVKEPISTPIFAKHYIMAKRHIFAE